MAQLKVPVDDFRLKCTYTCKTEQTWRTDDAGAPTTLYLTTYAISAYPQTVTQYVRFAVDLPEGAVVTSATVHATLDNPLYGAAVSTINGQDAAPLATSSIEVEIADGETSVVVPFRFCCGAVSHQHDPDAGDFTDSDNDVVDTETDIYYKRYYWWEHESYLHYTDVYLLIEYTPPFTPPTLNPYTDPRLYVGETYVKAVHMTELHTNANLVRTAYHLPEYEFPDIVAGESLLASWNEDVIELRVALDEIGVEHEEWLLLDFNRPRLDVLLQLRRVVAALAAGDGEQVETDGVQLYTADGEMLMDADGLYFKALEGN